VSGFVRADGIDIDDDPARVDVAAVQRFLSAESYWAKGRDLGTVTRLVSEATRVVGAYDGPRQIGFARCLSDRVSVAWMADVFVLVGYRGRRIGEDVVRHLIEASRFADVRWMLGTADAHCFYAKFGFVEPGPRLLERPRRHGDPPRS
jgi:GNAT superfamily N-acetyltransferase